MPFWQLFYHVVWGTKGREPLIKAEWEESLHNAIVAKAKELGAFVYAVGGTDDHVHLVVSVPPKLALSFFVGQVKGNSSHFVTHDLARGPAFEWQDEYGIVSFGQKTLDMVARYTRRQHEHHTTGTCIPFLERVEESIRTTQPAGQADVPAPAKGRVRGQSSPEGLGRVVHGFPAEEAR